ncbi:MAG: hypothetical protein AAFR61_18315 [Bacteroidota bacterium]
MSVKLLFVREENLRDRLFVKDLVHNFSFKEKALMILDTFGASIPDVKFVTRRLSALFSEAMVYNNAFTADQRGIFRLREGKLDLNRKLVDDLFHPIQLLIIGPVLTKGEEKILADPLDLLQLARIKFEVDEILLFPNNPLSPLAQKTPLIGSPEDHDRWMKLYEEEEAVLNLAYQLRPARIVSPMNYSREMKQE